MFMKDVPHRLPEQPRRFMDRFRTFIRSRQMAYKTEQTYCLWVKNYIHFHDLQHPEKLSAKDVDAYLSYLAVQRNVSVNTQKTALNALVFLYHQFLSRPLGRLEFQPSSRLKTLPTVFSHNEAMRVIDKLEGDAHLAASLMYGAGLRVMECVRLRLQDIDFEQACIIVREAKGNKWRRTLLPKALIPSLRLQIEYVTLLFSKDRKAGIEGVYLPSALARKYPNAPFEAGWQYFFPSSRVSLIYAVGLVDATISMKVSFKRQ